MNIIELAKATGQTKWFGTHPDGTNDFLGVEFTPEQLERFAALVRAEALAESDMNLNCPSVQARLATVWGYVKAEPVKQEPVAYMVKAHDSVQRFAVRADVADEFACKWRETDPDADFYPLYAAPVQPVKQEPVHEALQIASVALQDIACSSQTENLYWWQLRARKAQKQIAECLTNAASVEPAKREPVAGVRCKIVESCKSCQHSFGRKSCALAEREFDSLERQSTPPEWCPLPLYAAPVQPVNTRSCSEYSEVEYSEPVKSAIMTKQQIEELSKKMWDELQHIAFEENTPKYWTYVVNNTWRNIDEQQPPEDAYDEGTLEPLYAAPVDMPQAEPTSVDAKAIRAEALEEAAKVCDELVLEHPSRADKTADQCAAAIRGLK